MSRFTQNNVLQTLQMNTYSLSIYLEVCTYGIKGGVLAQYGIVEMKCVGSLKNYLLNYLFFVGSKLELD
jgi:hypothetical protein